MRGSGDRTVTIERGRPNGRRHRLLTTATTAAIVVALSPVVSGAAGATATAHAAAEPAKGAYLQTNLVSDVPGRALVTDPKLVNPWGISSSPAGSPFWVSDAGTGVSTLYNGSGQPTPLVVTVPTPAGAAGTSSPTGQVFNGSTDFAVTKGAAKLPATFIFTTEDGTVAGWAAAVDARTAITMFDNSANAAVYKGMTMANNGSGNFLYLADFHNGKVDVLDGHYALQPASAFPFSDPTLPAGYAPFNVRAIGSNVYVTYAQQDADRHDDVAGPGHGFVDVFNTNGVFVRRLASQGPLNSPWGLTMAPATFGTFAGDLLVGNFGDGHISAFDPATGALVGQLSGANGSPIVIDGLWGLWFGNGGNGGLINTLYFAAGTDGEKHGLFGALTPAGYWLAAADGGVFAYGAAGFLGSMGGRPLNSPVVGISGTPDGQGYWLGAADGGIFAFGSAPFVGSMGGRALVSPITGVAGTPDGKGYWLVAGDGGVFAFGTAGFFGSMGGQPLGAPIVGMAAAPDGKGYWLVASDGGVFGFGSARFLGNLVGITKARVVGITATPFQPGYWIATEDGGVWPFGSAAFVSAPPGLAIDHPVAGIAAAPNGTGVWLPARDGGVVAMGRGVPALGSTVGLGLSKPVVGIVAVP